MKTTVANIVTNIHQGRKTGLLTLRVIQSNNLFKIFFRDGQIYHISFGNIKGADCLSNIDSMDFSDYSFIADIKLDIPVGSLPATVDIIKHLEIVEKMLESKGTEGGGAALNAGPSAPVDSGRFGRIGEQLKVALVRQIGPAGGRIFDRVVERKWQSSSPPQKSDLVNLINLLKEEIDDMNDRKAFIDEANEIIK
ncbi:MAG TPA: hypothetical protein VMB78_00235 [Dissulfurispiraceae bacterium]|nr:hypothetical protein [Dissulfurispiraceae bacterium]